MAASSFSSVDASHSQFLFYCFRELLASWITSLSQKRKREIALMFFHATTSDFSRNVCSSSLRCNGNSDSFRSSKKKVLYAIKPKSFPRLVIDVNIMELLTIMSSNCGEEKTLLDRDNDFDSNTRNNRYD